MRTLTTGLGILALTGTLLVGCGGDDDVATALREGEAPADDAGAGDDRNPLTDDGSDPGSGGGMDRDDDNPLTPEVGAEPGPGSTAPDRDGEGSGDAPDDFCAKALDIQERFAALEDTEVPRGEQLAEVSDAFSDLADDAPDEIADDMDALAGALAALGEVLDRIDIEDPKSLEGLEEESSRLEAEFGDLEQAGEDVETYFRDECGIDLGDDGGSADDGSADDGSADDGSADDGSADGGGTATEPPGDG